jgi:hypothetical protein
MNFKLQFEIKINLFLKKEKEEMCINVVGLEVPVI